MRTVNSSPNSNLQRRTFLKQSTIAAAAALAAPMIWTSKTRGAEDQLVIGTGPHQYRVHHQWAKLPEPYSWQTTHNVAVDAAHNLYVIHEGRENLKDHPSIFVFDPTGKYIRSFGAQFQGGGHGLEVRKEGNEEFLYVTAYQQVKSFAKMTLKGETVWEQRAPMASGKYAKEEDTNPQKVWGRDRFMPTNFAFLDDGGFLLADGYGAFQIHRYDKDGKWLKCFGGAGAGQGTFDTPHGIWIDRRTGREPRIVVTDRAHNTLQFFDLDGNYVETLEGFGLPANVDCQGDLLLVPELLGSVTLLGPKNETLVRLGDDKQRIVDDKGFSIRGDESKWNNGKFIHPHDACFDTNGDIYVAEWVHSGRITKLEKV